MKQKCKTKRPESPMLAETRKLFKEGYSIKRAMLEAGYSPSTVKKKAWEYLRRMDIDELKKGLRIQAALTSHKAYKVLNDKLDTAERDKDVIDAADAVLKSAKTFLGKDDTPTTLVWAFQTFQGDTTIEMTSPEKPDEIIDVGKEPQKED